MVTVLTKSNCVQCDWTVKLLERERIPYRTEDITSDENMERVKQLGYLSAPVVIVGEESWSGFQPARLQELAA